MFLKHWKLQQDFFNGILNMKLKHQQMASRCLSERVIDSNESFRSESSL